MKRDLLILVLVASFRPLVLAAPPEIVVCHYNVRNYVNSTPADETHKYATRAKPAAEIKALTSIIKDT